jgi:hypothetical protein
MLVLWLDEEMEVVQVLDDEPRCFTLVHGEKDLLDGGVATMSSGPPQTRRQSADGPGEEDAYRWLMSVGLARNQRVRKPLIAFIVEWSR